MISGLSFQFLFYKKVCQAYMLIVHIRKLFLIMWNRALWKALVVYQITLGRNPPLLLPYAPDLIKPTMLRIMISILLDIHQLHHSRIPT